MTTAAISLDTSPFSSNPVPSTSSGTVQSFLATPVESSTVVSWKWNYKLREEILLSQKKP
jgi:hypothetical protein